jgi:hypothetical protein
MFNINISEEWKNSGIPDTRMNRFIYKTIYGAALLIVGPIVYAIGFVRGFVRG